MWDTRRGGPEEPLALIAAHTQKIYGIDWSRGAGASASHTLLSCSQDRTVRFWSVDSPDSCLGVIRTPEPVWRALFAPFGDGVVTIAARANNSIRLWRCPR